MRALFRLFLFLNIFFLATFIGCSGQNAFRPLKGDGQAVSGHNEPTPGNVASLLNFYPTCSSSNGSSLKCLIQVMKDGALTVATGKEASLNFQWAKPASWASVVCSESNQGLEFSCEGISANEISLIQILAQDLLTGESITKNPTVTEAAPPAVIPPTFKMISSMGAPSFAGRNARWTGDRLIVFDSFMSGGYSYDPVTDTWQVLPPVSDGLYRTGSPFVEWTGKYYIVWGGMIGYPNLTNMGSRYDPVTNQWTTMSTTNAPAPAYMDGPDTGWTSAVWTGQYFAVIPPGGGQGGLYDPNTDTWTPIVNDPIANPAAPGDRWVYTLNWTGSELMLWGGYTSGFFTSRGSLYNISTQTWTDISVGAPGARWRHSAVTLPGNKVFVFGGEFWGSYCTNTGAILDVTTRQWKSSSLVNAPTGRCVANATLVGNKVMIYGGTDGTRTPVSGLKFYYPDTDTWSSNIDVPIADRALSSAGVKDANGNIFLWGGLNVLQAGVNVTFSDGVIFNPGSSF